MKSPDVLLALLGLLLAGGPATAMTVSVSPDPPSPADVLVGHDVAAEVGSYLCTHGTGTAVDIGQTFRLDRSAVLDRITLKLRPVTDRTAGELVTLVLGTFSDPADDSMNQLLAAETQVLPSSIPTGEVRYVTFDIADLSLEGGRQYGFLLGFTGGDHVKDARLDVLHVGADAYVDGQAVEEAGAVTSPFAYDLVFFLHGASQVAGEALLLHGGRFRVEAAWRDFQGGTGAGAPVPLTDASGYFWFFAPDNVELVVKVLDACVDPFNHFWVFAVGLTNVEVTLTVTDTWAGEQWSYVNPLWQAFPPILGTTALATCGALPP